MSGVAETDMLAGNFTGVNMEFYEGDAASAMIDASIFGNKAKFGFRGSDLNDPTNSGENAEEKNVYLTFSGGGHSLEFGSPFLGRQRR